MLYDLINNIKYKTHFVYILFTNADNSKIPEVQHKESKSDKNTRFTSYL